MFCDHLTFSQTVKMSRWCPLDVQKKEMASVFDLHFYFKPTQTEFNFSQGFYLFVLESCKSLWSILKVHLIPGIFTNMGLLSHCTHSFLVKLSHSKVVPPISFLAPEPMVSSRDTLGYLENLQLAKCRKLFWCFHTPKNILLICLLI